MIQEVFNDTDIELLSVRIGDDIMSFNNNSIFTITTFCYCKNDDTPVSNLRTPGFYHNFDEAETDVMNNACDIWEYTYNYAVIEELKPGVYPQCVNRHFYKFNLETKKYESILTPKGLEHITGFSIG